jgi:hypothetical protein
MPELQVVREKREIMEVAIQLWKNGISQLKKNRINGDRRGLKAYHCGSGRKGLSTGRVQI